MKLMAFLLIVIVAGEEVNTSNMYFKNINRCRYFADRLEDNEAKVTAYCKPVMVSPNTTFRD
tara:strand:+ start:481 stop:666 length:186 start_codon:yes stop_codon:yes gene_type:complete